MRLRIGEDFGLIPMWRCNWIITYQRIFNILFCRSADNRPAVDLIILHNKWRGRSSPVIIAEWSSLEARLAHAQEVGGSNPSSAIQ